MSSGNTTFFNYHFLHARLAVIKAKPFGGQFIFPAITPLLIEAGLDVEKLEEVGNF